MFLSKLIVRIDYFIRGGIPVNTENHFLLFGQKLKDNSELLTEKLFQKDIPDPSYQYSDIHSTFFSCLGNSLNDDEHAAFERIVQWSQLFFKRVDQFDIQIHAPFFLGNQYRSVILDYIEEYLLQTNIHSIILVQIIKKIDSFINYGASLFSNNRKQMYEQDMNKFNQAMMDKKITIAELKALKKALKEATILTVTDKDDIITYANTKFCNITKYSLDELIGKNHNHLLNSGYHDDNFFKNIVDHIKSGKMWKGEIRNKAKDGSFYWVDSTIVPIVDRMGKTYQHIAIQHDITDQKETEEMLLKTEKLSMVGELAAGIAHEIRNPLTTIRGFVQILDHFSEDKKYLYSKTILSEIDRINLIVSEFMVFAKPHAVYFNECNVIDILNNALHLLGAEASLKNIEISMNFHPTNIYIYGEKNQLTQVFLNIIKNSIEAIPYGGLITISVTIKNNQVLTSIKDNGIGMTEEQVNKIGQPFYTTKDDGNGLGLMVSYKIIEKHKGRITIDSEPNKGTEFLISFPLFIKNRT